MSEGARLSATSAEVPAGAGGVLKEFHALFARVAPTTEDAAAAVHAPPGLPASAQIPGLAPDSRDLKQSGDSSSAQSVPQALADAPTEPMPVPGAALVETSAASARRSQRQPAIERKRRSEPAPQRAEANVQSWALIGPPGAGKTSLVAAFDAACFGKSDGDGELSISWLREGGQADRVQQTGQRWIGHGVEPSSTREPTAYSFELMLGRPARWLRTATPVIRQLRCKEEPGQSLFATAPFPMNEDGDAAGRRLAELANASSLILAVDATRPCAATLEATLPGLLDRISSSRPGERGWAGAAGWMPAVLRGSAPPSIRRTRLAARRLLVLLTKIDLLAEPLARRRGASASIEEAARTLDPVALAFQVLGPRCMRRLFHSLGRDAELAIGVSSACGFSPDGAEGFPRWSQGRSAHERIRAWEPFGVREALRFLATGALGATVQRIDARDLETTATMPFPSFLSPGAQP